MPAAAATSPSKRLLEIAIEKSAEPKAGTPAQRMYDLASRVHREAMIAHRRGLEEDAAFFRLVSEAIRRQADATA